MKRIIAMLVAIVLLGIFSSISFGGATMSMTSEELNIIPEMLKDIRIFYIAKETELNKIGYIIYKDSNEDRSVYIRINRKDITNPITYYTHDHIIKDKEISFYILKEIGHKIELEYNINLNIKENISDYKYDPLLQSLRNEFLVEPLVAGMIDEVTKSKFKNNKSMLK